MGQVYAGGRPKKGGGRRRKNGGLTSRSKSWVLTSTVGRSTGQHEYPRKKLYLATNDNGWEGPGGRTVKYKLNLRREEGVVEGQGDTRGKNCRTRGGSRKRKGFGKTAQGPPFQIRVRGIKSAGKRAWRKDARGRRVCVEERITSLQGGGGSGQGRSNVDEAQEVDLKVGGGKRKHGRRGEPVPSTRTGPTSTCSKGEK